MTPTTTAKGTASSLEIRIEVDDFNTAYALCIDEDRIEEWPSFFVEDAVYCVTGRENLERDLPGGIVYCDSRDMLEDRVYAVRQTIVHAPRYFHHMLSPAQITAVRDDGAIEAKANFLVHETLVDQQPRVFLAGRYYDRFLRHDGELLLKKRVCVYDTLLIPNSLIYPV